MLTLLLQFEVVPFDDVLHASLQEKEPHMPPVHLVGLDKFWLYNPCPLNDVWPPVDSFFLCHVRENRGHTHTFALNRTPKKLHERLQYLPNQAAIG